MESIIPRLQVYINFIKTLSKTVGKNNVHFIFTYIFLHYVRIRLQRLLEMDLHWITLPDKALKYLVNKYAENNEYIDDTSCVLVNISYLEESRSNFWYVCCKGTQKMYKVLTAHCPCMPKDTVVISDTLSFNITKALCCTEMNNMCFMRPSSDTVCIAVHAKICMVANPYEYAPSLVDALLKNYFSDPRFLRLNDVFCIDTKEYSPDLLYSSSHPTFPPIYFKVKMLKSKHAHISATRGSFILFGETTLVQETNVHSYLPQRHSYSIPSELSSMVDYQLRKYFFNNYLPILEEPLQCLEDCILPFTKKVIDTGFYIKPVFLVKGSEGCGKSQVIQMISEKIGLNLYNVDFTEVQTLTPAQTEAKFRIVLHNAKNCAPCILSLPNIQIFGKNSEGENDERVLYAFAAELRTLYETIGEFPVIVIATADETDLPVELQRLFIETISTDHLTQSQKKDLILWLLENKGLHYSEDMTKVVELCSDFRLADINTLISHAVKIQYTRSEEKELTLSNRDFMDAYEYMQSIYNDCKGVPRIPKVYWEDIGGLADLKHDIMRRIQLPMMDALGFTQSGLLLYGPPGTGKTLLAKAVATEYQLHFLSVKGPEVLNMYVGQSEKNVRQIFEEARIAAPCIIFFDELDSLAPNRGRSGDSGGVMDRVVSQLLAEMDGLEESKGIFIIGATNRPDLIDPALLRPGRFDKMLYVGIHSDKSSKLSVLKAITRKFKLSDDDGTDLECLLGHLPPDVTGADLYAVCSDAWLRAARRALSEREKDPNTQRVGKMKLEGTSEKEDENDIVTVEIQDFIEAARCVVPSVSKEEMLRYKKLQAELS